MPRQNRVTPFGDIVAVPARGRFMGNRGCLHDASGRIVRPYRLTNWIYCVLSFKGRRRFPLMQPGRYTELFFLDEATALAAGHRPCAECQRGRFDEFMRCWALGNPGLVGQLPLRAPVVDAVLQKERIGPKGEKVKWRARLGELPVGVMVEMHHRSGQHTTSTQSWRRLRCRGTAAWARHCVNGVFPNRSKRGAAVPLDVRRHETGCHAD